MSTGLSLSSLMSAASLKSFSPVRALLSGTFQLFQRFQNPGSQLVGAGCGFHAAPCPFQKLRDLFGRSSQRQFADADRIAREEAVDRHFEPRDDEVLQGAARILTPLVLVFGLYIIANGHLSPGGGFSGGAILGAGLILYQNAFGYRKTERFFTYRTFKWVSLASLLFYSLAKGYHFFTGANHLENGISPGTAGNILSGGLLLPLNFVVGCVVACTMYALYTMFRKGDF